MITECVGAGGWGQRGKVKKGVYCLVVGLQVINPFLGKTQTQLTAVSSRLDVRTAT